MNTTRSTTTIDGFDSFQLYLLLEATSRTSEDTILDVAQKPLKLTQIHEPAGAPTYTCISYVWEDEKTVNPFDCGAARISPHTLPALVSAVHNFDTAGFWIDAFCVPPSWPEKGATLESMAYIFLTATQIAIVLSEKTYAAIQTMLKINKSRNKNRTDETDGSDEKAKSASMALAMQHLEESPWIRSVWTYQEVINNYNLYFISSDPRDPPLHCQDILNNVFHCIQQFTAAYKERGLNPMERFPYLSALEDLLVDWKLAGYENRSALHAMVGMQGRECAPTHPENWWYSIIGSIAVEKVARPTNPTMEQLAERFMYICEQRGDFSFLFAAVERDDLRRWRPKPKEPKELPPVLCMGGSIGVLEGQYNGNGELVLENMIKYSVQSTTPGKVFHEWLESWRQNTKSGKRIPENHREKLDAVVPILLGFLKEFRFTGTGECIAVDDGLFYPQWLVPKGSEAVVLVPTTISFRMGAPALVVVGDGEWYAPGVFIGPVEKQGEKVVLKSVPWEDGR
ncbi:heterokaryon incompatibility protein-domain-containing protein [Trichophaea hybrida]|nr:heterokaryon incompatibility protein-domain-containing protein [Trichophaea hybrida]